jgi:hypothetical protein
MHTYVKLDESWEWEVAQVSLAEITRIIPARGIFNVVVIKI